jgi:hypothetical protein
MFFCRLPPHKEIGYATLPILIRLMHGVSTYIQAPALLLS